MRRIRIYRHPDCPKCARYARVHQSLDWLHRVDVSTDTPKTGPLRLGEVVVEKLDDGRVLRGADGLREICRQIPAYAPFSLLLRLPAVRAFAEREMTGCGGEMCGLAVSRDQPTKALKS
jgi:hypothetical protein